MAFSLSPPYRIAPHTASQHGTGMVEFLLVAVPLLLTALGGIEISHWMFSRQAVNLALVEAGRAGATLHANPQAIIKAFEQALEPLYPPTESATSAQRVQAAFGRSEAHHGQQPWHIQLLSPAQAHFQDFRSTDPVVKHRSGLPTIDNSYQLEQHQNRTQQGWPDGKGPGSGQTIFEANTLALRLTWRYKPLLPGIERITGNLLSLKQDVTITMQSHPVFWPDDPAGRVTRHADGHGPNPAAGHALPPAQAPDAAGAANPSATQNDLPLWPGEMPAGPANGANGAAASGGERAAHGRGPVTDGVTGGYGSNNGGTTGLPEPSGHNGPHAGGPAASEPGPGTPSQSENQGDMGYETGVSEGNICTNISPSLIIPSSERARSSMASRPDFRS